MLTTRAILTNKAYAIILAMYPWWSNYVYAYCTDEEGQVYDLIALLENDNSLTCQSRCWEMHVASKQEGENIHWCQGCGGYKNLSDYDSEAMPKYMNRIYSVH